MPGRMFYRIVTVLKPATANLAAFAFSGYAMLRTPLALALSVVSLVVGNCLATPADSSAGALTVAQVADLSGPGADFNRDYGLGAKVYFDHINTTGGIRGRHIAFRTADTAGSRERAQTLSEALIKDKVDVLFGLANPGAVDALIKDSNARASGVPLFGPVAGNPQLGLKDGVFYLRASILDEVRAMLSQLGSIGVTSFGIAVARENGQATLDALAEEARTAGVRVITSLPMTSSIDGANAAANQLLKQRPQAVIVIADTLTAAQFFKQYRSLDPGAFLCAPSTVNIKTLISAIGPAAARGLILSQVVPAPGGILDVAREHKRLMDKFADEPVSPATLEGFIAAKTLVMAMQRNREGSATALRQNLKSDGRYDLGGYQLDFTRGDRASHFVELTVVNSAGRLLR